MPVAQFGEDGVDRATFAPVLLRRVDDSGQADFRMSFGDEWGDWERFHELAGGESLAGCYLNGHGLARLLYAARHQAGLEPEPLGMEYNSSADSCFVRFVDLGCAVESAEMLAGMLRDRAKLAEVIAYAQEHGLAD